MQLEAGKKYTDRRGRVYGPLVKTGVRFFGEDKETSLWEPNGTISYFDLDMDLVAEYVEPVKAAEPEYRMLQEGELILSGDEYNAWDGKWERIPYGINRPFSSRINVPHRRLVKPEETKAAEPAPVESPDDWVIQDRVPARNGIDHGWFAPCVTEASSHPWLFRSGVNAEGRKHGDKMTWGDTLNVYCKRKDLPPIESPDDWVILDPVVYAEHELRKDIDWMEYGLGWHAVNGFAGTTVERFLKPSHHKAVRCLRKDLPPVPPKKPKTRTVVLKEWLCWQDDEPEAVALEWFSLDPSENHGDLVEWDHAHATGNTRTVEIPVT